MDDFIGKAEVLMEALPYFQRLVKEFEKSDYLSEAQKRSKKGQPPHRTTGVASAN